LLKTIIILIHILPLLIQPIINSLFLYLHLLLIFIAIHQYISQ
jgi:hypothetical protein